MKPMLSREEYEDRLRALELLVTDVDGVLCPPALFKRAQFAALQQLEGDAGAKSVFRRLPNTKTVPLAAKYAIDIDQVADLQRAKDMEDA